VKGLPEDEMTPSTGFAWGRGAAPQKMDTLVPACRGGKGARPFSYWVEFLAASFFLSEKRNRILTNPHITHKAYPSLPLYNPRGSAELPAVAGPGSGMPRARTPAGLSRHAVLADTSSPGLCTQAHRHLILLVRRG